MIYNENISISLWECTSNLMLKMFSEGKRNCAFLQHSETSVFNLRPLYWVVTCLLGAWGLCMPLGLPVHHLACTTQLGGRTGFAHVFTFARVGVVEYCGSQNATPICFARKLHPRLTEVLPH